MFLVKLAFYPLYLLTLLLRVPQKKRLGFLWYLERFFAGIVLVIFLLPIWLAADVVIALAVARATSSLAWQAGLTRESVYIAGTGSMYPTFPKGTSKTTKEKEQETVAIPNMRAYPGGFALFGKRYVSYTLKHGDIVSFINDTTEKIIADGDGENNSDSTDSSTNSATLSGSTLSGFVKRVIGLPGDTIEIRDGFVLRNGERLLEPYTASARSTFGGEFLPDCTALSIPAGKVFVMGDNRKGSLDSRHTLGLVGLEDIHQVFPLEEQTPFEAQWHDPSNDNEQANTVTLDPQEYLRRLNEIRASHNVKPLKYNDKLAQSAALRAKIMLKYNDLSFEATKSGYTMRKALNQVGYANIVYGEAPTLGYYTAEELLENYAQFPQWEAFLLDKQYQDTGIAAVLGEVRGCPTQIIVQHVAGYVPPNYKKADIESWQTLITRLQEILPSWERARSYGGQYEDHKQDYERMISILHERLSIAQTIYAKMSANQWFNDNEKAMIQRDNTLGEEQQALANKLNSL